MEKTSSAKDCSFFLIKKEKFFLLGLTFSFVLFLETFLFLPWLFTNRSLVKQSQPVAVKIQGEAAPPLLSAFCFPHISDTHIDTSYGETRMKEVISYFNSSIKPPFVINTGDVTSNNDSTQSRTNYDRYKRAITTSLVPVYTVPGNHDCQAFSIYAEKLGSDKVSFDYNTFRFIGFNSINSVVCKTDYTWIGSQLSGVPAGKAMLFSHLAVEWPPELTHALLNMNEEHRNKFRDLIYQNRVIAYSSGHLHESFVYYNPTKLVLNIGAPAVIKKNAFRLICVDNGKVNNLHLSLGQVPIVVITDPEEYLDKGERGKVSGNIRIGMKAFSDKNITAIKYKIDNGSWIVPTSLTNNAWEGYWNTTSVSPGAHTITAEVTDANIKTFQHTIKVFVVSGPTPTPTGAILSPTPTPTSVSIPTPTPTRLPTPTSTQAPLPTGAGTVILQQGVNGYTGAKDTYLYIYDNSSNYCESNQLKVGYKQQNASLIAFDLSSIPSGAVVETATLSLYATGWGGSNFAIDVFKVFKNWVDCQATWVKATSTTNWTTAGCNGTTDKDSVPLASFTTVGIQQWYDVNLTSTVQGWINNPSTNAGILLKQQATGIAYTYYFAAAEHSTSSYRPKTTIRYH